MHATRRALCHTAPWMKGKQARRSEQEVVEGVVVLFTGAAHGLRAPGMVRLGTGDELKGKRVRSAGCGVGHVVLLLDDGLVATFGDNRHGQCGGAQHADVYSSHHKKTLKVFEEFEGTSGLKVAAGARHTFVYTPGTRDVMIFGENNHCQLGIPGHQDIISPHTSVLGATWAPPVPDAEGGIVSISTSATHSLMVMESGAVYAWGCALDGQLGTGSTTAHSRPFKVKFFAARGLPVAKAHAGHSCSFFVTSEGTVFGSGKYDEGRLGLPWTPHTPVTLLPKKVPLGEPPVMLSTGLAHCTYVTQEGAWWGFGGSQKLGLSMPMCKDIADIRYDYNTEAYAEPHVPRCIVEGAGDVKELSSGHHHTVGLTSAGTVVGTGWNSDRQLSGDTESYRDQLVALHSNPHTASATAGGAFTVITINAGAATPNTWADLPLMSVV